MRGISRLQALFRMFQHSLHLFASHAWKSFEKIIHVSAIFQILKQRHRIPIPGEHIPLGAVEKKKPRVKSRP